MGKWVLKSVNTSTEGALCGSTNGLCALASPLFSLCTRVISSWFVWPSLTFLKPSGYSFVSLNQACSTCQGGWISHSHYQLPAAGVWWEVLPPRKMAIHGVGWSPSNQKFQQVWVFNFALLQVHIPHNRNFLYTHTWIMCSRKSLPSTDTNVPKSSSKLV